MSEAFDFDSVPSRLKMDWPSTSSQPALDRVIDEPHLSTTCGCSTSGGGWRSRPFSVFVTAVVYTFTATPRYRAGAAAHRAREPERRQLQAGHRRRPGQGGLLPDAVQDPAEPRAGRRTRSNAETVGQRRNRFRRPSHGGSAVCWRESGRRPGRLGQPGQAGDETHVAVEGDRRVPGTSPSRRSATAAWSTWPSIDDASWRRESPTRWRRGTSSRASSSSSCRRRRPPTGWAGSSPSSARRWKQAEAALQRYREQNDAVSLEERQNIVVQKLADLNAAVTRAKTERIEKEAHLQPARRSQADRAALDTFPAF